MYLHIHKDKECSRCGALNQTELVSRGNDLWPMHHIATYLRCLKCGHEKELYTTSTNSTGGPVSYTLEPTNNKEIF